MIANRARWSARWIEPVEPADLRGVQRPIYQLAGSFTVDGASSAQLRITAHGIYEAFLNGERVGDRELTPGLTAYRKRLQVQHYDVSRMLRPGENVLGVQLSDGWWRGQVGIMRLSNAFGNTTGVLAELTITAGSGDTTVFGTDGSWLFTTSHVEAADLIAGEIHDMRIRRDDWGQPGVDRSSWKQVRVADHGFDQLCETVGPPVRRVQELPAVSVVEVRPRRHIVDFGQVSNGWVRLTNLGPRGTRLTLVHGECLSPDGDDVQIEALSGETGRHAPNWELSFQTDVVVSNGDGEVFEPRHSTKGFRYVRIDGHPGPLAASALTSVVVHTDVASRGSFMCSDDDLNWLHTAADWSLRSNLCDIPTDCPTRERAGWTGDWQIYIDTAAYLYDVTDLSVKWLSDVAADQLGSGAVPHFVPDPTDYTKARPPWWADIQGSAGWGDAIVHVPWELYRSTGSTEVLRPFFAAMCRWVDFAAERAASSRHPRRAAARPTPAAHERYLWDTGFHFGEWNEPGTTVMDADPDDGNTSGIPAFVGRLLAADHGPIATAYLFRSADELKQIAALLGDHQKSERYGALAANVLAAWRSEFIEETGHVRPATQPNLVRALAFGLVPEALRQQAADDLAALVRAAGSHLGTGFLATPFLLPVLADQGHLELAYDVLFQRTAPSWLAMRDRGATTIWEGWTPFDDKGWVKESLNHFSMGAVVGFLHRYVAGLQIAEPGYRRFAVSPRPAAGLTWAAAAHDTPYGRVEVRWQLVDDQGTLEVTVPTGTTADVLLPGREPELLGPGQHVREWNSRTPLSIRAHR